MASFYAAGGWPMHFVSVFGFLMLAASVLYALRPKPRFQRLVVTLGVVTFGWGLLGTAIGISLSTRYIQEVPEPRQLQILSLGIEESLHDVVLALILIIVAGIITAVGILRSSSPLQPAS